jgi:hypothetical protein
MKNDSFLLFFRGEAQGIDENIFPNQMKVD